MGVALMYILLTLNKFFIHFVRFFENLLVYKDIPSGSILMGKTNIDRAVIKL